ncbi:TetR/AcrR family transcriptional regulator [Longispora albida]|uniref:TetR/AcrR family transcriptional regulator n=1 Tax=Longispora albida TaxID=203523 RepID=UPI0003677302|nr:TetR/AcrR family transcriptional regulator [Longispora albida]
MPRITAPTVAEHRSRRLEALLEAGRELVTEGGPDALTLANLAKRVGLSRPSLYEYFRSREDLAAAIVEDELPRWTALVAESLGGEAPLAEKLTSYVQMQLELMRDGRHAAAVALSAHALPEDARQRIRDGHQRLLEPLVDTLADAGVAEPRLRAMLIQGIVESANRLPVPDGTALVAVTVDQILHGIDTK